ncbi:flippase, partial [Candidatus Poribacteria bacterium]|nr:flippase [Candidatus Poribacteria bacterium]
MSNSIIKNTSSLLIAHFTGRILTFILTIILPRYLANSFDDLGKYFTALWLANLLAAITELGLYTPIIREVAADRSKASQVISNALVIRLFLSIFTLIILVILARFMYSRDMAPIIYILGISETISALTQLFWRIFRAFERMEFEAISLLLERFLVFSLGLLVVIISRSVIAFSMVALGASILNFVITLGIMLWKFSRPSLKFLDIKLCRHLLEQALPFALSGALSTIYLRIDGLMLKQILGTDGNLAMGWYGTGYNLVMSLTIIPGAFTGAIFPVMARMSNSSANALSFLYTKSLKLMLILAFPLAVGMTFLADNIVLIMYPSKDFSIQDQEALSRVLEILIWAGALTFLNFVLITILRAANKRRAFLIIMVMSLTANIISNILLIPIYKHTGPAIS